MRLLCNAGDTGNALGAEAMLDRLISRVPQRLKRMVVNTAIKACIQNGDLARATRHLQAMKAHRVAPSDRTFGKLMIVAKKAGNHRQMGLFFKEMLDRGIQPTSFACNAVLSAMGNGGGLDDAERWFDRFVEEGLRPDSETFHTMISVAANNSNLARAEHWHEQGLRAGVELSAASYAKLSRVAQLVGNASASEFWFDQGLGAGRDPLSKDYTSMEPFRQRRLMGRPSRPQGRAEASSGSSSAGGSGSSRSRAKEAPDADAAFQSLAGALSASQGSRGGIDFGH